MANKAQQIPYTPYGHEEDNIFLSFLFSKKGPERQFCKLDKKIEAPVRSEHLLRPKLLQEIKLSQIIVIVIILARSLSVNNRKPVFFEARVLSVFFLQKFQTEQSEKCADII